MRIRNEQKGVIFLVFIVLILVALGTVVYFSLRTDPVQENLKSDPVVKTLIVIEDEGKALFTDVFIFYPESGKGALVSIPGNTGSIFQSLGRVDRIDAIYAEKGMDEYRNEIQRLIDMKLSFMLKISLDDFIRFTDLSGGMEVFIPSPVDARGPDGELWLMPSGAVTLDGDKVRSYMTYRLEDETESEVQERRQNMVVALLSAIKRCKTYMFRKDNIDDFTSCFWSEVDKEGLTELLRMISEVDCERLTLLDVTGQNRNVDGKLLLFPFRNGDFIKEVVKRTTSSIVSESGVSNTRSYVLEIQNGTRVQGLAKNTSILLQGAGFEVLNVSNAPNNDYEKTTIIDHIGNRDAAKSIGDFIRCTNIIEEEVSESSDETPNVDFTLILGRDFDSRYVHGQTSSGDNAPGSSQ